MEGAVQTVVVVLSMAFMIGAAALAIRYINKCWRRVERIQPLQELEEKERERAEFVRTHLPTRIWRSHPGSSHSMLPSASSMHQHLDHHHDHHILPPDVLGLEVPLGSSVASSSLAPSSSLSPARGGGGRDGGGSRGRGGGGRHQPPSPQQVRRRDSFDSWSVEEPELARKPQHGAAAAVASDASLLNLSCCSGDSSTSHTLDADLGFGGRARCAICSRSYRDGRDVVCDSNSAFCTHVFHADCMATWLVQNPRCPLCRHEYLMNFAAKWKAAEMPPERPPARPARAAAGAAGSAAPAAAAASATSSPDGGDSGVGAASSAAAKPPPPVR
jgi:hypothetical protein